MTETQEEKAVAVVQAPPTAIAAVPVEGMLKALDDYRRLQAGLDKAMPDQLMAIQGKEFRKKGYWRAVARAFNLDVTEANETRIEDGNDWGYIVTYRATYHPNGGTGAAVSTTGDGACFATEKQRGRMQATVHNVRAHAHTRAFNRAVSNCVGFGEVSAEEINFNELDAKHDIDKVTPRPARKRTGPSKVELAHLHDAIAVVGVPPEVVREHCGKSATDLTPAEYRGVFGWLVETVCETVGWAASDVATEIVGICGTKKEAADLSADEFRALIEKMRGDASNQAAGE